MTIHDCPICGLTHKAKEPTNDVARELHAIADGLGRVDFLMRFQAKVASGEWPPRRLREGGERP